MTRVLVGGVGYRNLRDPKPSIYFPLRQVSFPVVPLTLAIRAAGDAADVIPAIRQRIGEGGLTLRQAVAG